jgi:hypothetical protein
LSMSRGVRRVPKTLRVACCVRHPRTADSSGLDSDRQRCAELPLGRDGCGIENEIVRRNHGMTWVKFPPFVTDIRVRTGSQGMIP